MEDISRLIRSNLDLINFLKPNLKFQSPTSEVLTENEELELREFKNNLEVNAPKLLPQAEYIHRQSKLGRDILEILKDLEKSES